MLKYLAIKATNSTIITLCMIILNILWHAMQTLIVHLFWTYSLTELRSVISAVICFATLLTVCIYRLDCNFNIIPFLNMYHAYKKLTTPMKVQRKQEPTISFAV